MRGGGTAGGTGFGVTVVPGAAGIGGAAGADAPGVGAPLAGPGFVEAAADIALSNFVVVWQPLQSTPVWCPFGRVMILTPYQVIPDSWQLMQVIAATGAWFIGVPPNVAKLAGAWQASQAMPATGM